MMLAAYKEFESRVGFFKKSKSKSDRVTDTVLSQATPFSVSQIKESCPEAGIDLIRMLLKSLHKAGKIEPLSRGRYAKWRVIR